MHEIIYPGLDREKCSVCGWICTKEEINRLELALLKLKNKTAKSNLYKLINNEKAKRKKHER